MKTIKIIDLLNKIANSEEVPNKIKLDEEIYEFNKWGNDYKSLGEEYNYWLFNDYCFGSNGNRLDNELEILDEVDEFEDIESFGVHYSWDYIDYKNIEELKKYMNEDFQNIFDTLDKLIKNQKKIIERLKDE